MNKKFRQKMNKRELELRCDDLQSAKDKLYNDSLDFVKQIDTLKSQMNSLEQEKQSILDTGNSKADFIRQILNILVGDAEVNSKYQVIRDMFLEQIKEYENRMSPPVYNQYQRNYPSDRISESDGIW